MWSSTMHGLSGGPSEVTCGLECMTTFVLIMHLHACLVQRYLNTRYLSRKAWMYAF